MKSRHVLNGFDGRVLQRDGAHLFEAGVVARYAEDPQEAVEPVCCVGPHISGEKLEIEI